MTEEHKKLMMEKLKWEVEQMNQIFFTIIIGLFLGISIPLLITTEGLTQICIAIIIFIITTIGVFIYHKFQSDKYSKINDLYNKL